MHGTIIPIGITFPGKANPTIGDGTVIAEGWYQLDEPELRELGVTETNERVLVNYEYEEVLPMRDPTYFEKYEVSKLLHDVKDYESGDSPDYVGTPLKNFSATDGKMYVNTETNEAFGDGWYYVEPSDLTGRYAGYAEYIKYPYVVNYETGKYKNADGFELQNK
jgi:hypothetical protein